MKNIALAFSIVLLASPAFASGDYSKKETTKAYEISLKVPAAALAIPKLKAEIMARWQKNAAEIKQESTSDLKEAPQYFHRYALDTIWRITFEDAKVISLSANSFIDEGGAHPNGAFDSIVWDKQANHAVAFADIFIRGQENIAYRAISDYARKLWIKQMTAEDGTPGDPAMAAEGIAPDADHLGHYALTYAKGEGKANGIVLLYGAGEVWPHVIGDIRLAIPLKVFGKYLKPEWASEFAKP